VCGGGGGSPTKLRLQMKEDEGDRTHVVNTERKNTCIIVITWETQT
jgi:hypothetical protein